MSKDENINLIEDLENKGMLDQMLTDKIIHDNLLFGSYDWKWCRWIRSNRQGGSMKNEFIDALAMFALWNFGFWLIAMLVINRPRKIKIPKREDLADD